ncbi:DUF3775 domain-containing protein [Phaeovulum sp.]|uniref:DUF3775 domain-containing protein n=1 Tax=Phaeovulum sp. TaxID=2934796 RepID=UPI0039E4A851
MLQISAAKIAYIIILAREFDAGVPGTGHEAELRNFIEALNDDEKANLVAVMWIGRETYDAEELAEAIATAKAEATVPTEDYLLGIPMLADYLEDGLDALGISLEDASEDVSRMI